MDNFDLRKYLVENKATTNSRMLTEASQLTPQEDKIYKDIISELDVLAEGTFSDMIDKVKKYVRRGLMSAAILASLLSTPGITSAQAASIQQAAGIEASAAPSTSKLQKVGDPIAQLKNALGGTSFSTGKYEGGSSINWGKGKPVGVYVSHDAGQSYIKVEILANGGSNTNFDQVVNNVNKILDGEVTTLTKTSLVIKVPASKISDIQTFIKASLPLMK
jgi:hypothetical protein